MPDIHTNTEIIDRNTTSLDAEVFVPIDLDWRIKYYRRVLKKRFFALLIDIFIFYLLEFIFTLIYFIGMGNNIYDEFAIDSATPLIVISSGLICAILTALMESSKRKGTFGKRIMKIEITDDFGNAISIWRSLWRNILKLLTFYSYCFYGIGLVIQFFTYKKTKKLFHDHFSKTIIGERL